jgi:hypothetical protein
MVYSELGNSPDAVLLAGMAKRLSAATWYVHLIHFYLQHVAVDESWIKKPHLCGVGFSYEKILS